LRFHPGLARLRQLLHAGAIGQPLTARLEMGEYLPGWHPWEDYRQSYSGRRDLGGGPVLTFSHELDSLCWLLGPPARLSALAAHTSSLDISTEDVAEVAMLMQSGALVSVHVDYVRRPPRRFVEIVGEAGVLRWEYDDNRVLQYVPGTRSWRVEDGDPVYDRNDMFKAELRQLVKVIERGSGETRLCNADQGAAVLSVALAALESAATGRAIDMSTLDEPGPTWLRSFEAFNIRSQ
jgi:predicted dehydrogenase